MNGSNPSNEVNEAGEHCWDLDLPGVSHPRLAAALVYALVVGVVLLAVAAVLAVIKVLDLVAGLLFSALVA